MSIFLEAILNDNPDEISFIIESQCNVNDKIEDNTYPLIYAIQQRKIKAAKFLIQCGADVNVIDEEQYTPLIQAIRYKLIDIITLLIEHKANLNYVRNEKSILMFAIDTHKTDIITAILNCGININEIISDQTALDYEMNNYSDPTIVEFLIEKGADIMIKSSGHIAYHRILFRGMLTEKIFKIIIQKGINLHELVENRPIYTYLLAYMDNDIMDGFIKILISYIFQIYYDTLFLKKELILLIVY